MPSKNTQGFAPLPKSYFFFTVSRGTGMRTFAVHTAVVALMAGLLPLLALIGTGAATYVIFHDDIVASLMARQAQAQSLYEDRLDALRTEAQRESARDAADRGAIEAKLRDLLTRADAMESRAATVAGIAALAEPESRHVESSAPRAVAERPPTDRKPSALPDAAMIEGTATSSISGPPAPGKPRPEPDSTAPARTSALDGDADTLDHDAVRKPVPAVRSRAPGPSIDHAGLPLDTRLSLVSASFDRVEHLQVKAVLKIGLEARDEASRLEAMLDEVGLSAERFRREVPQGQGGPFVPLGFDRGTAFGDAMMDLQDSLARSERLRGAVAHVPLADPLPGLPEVTSAFGARLDPFLGRPALHTGVDLREGFGTEVKATAPGRVIFAGLAGGYGNMVEVDHGNGLVSRYAHMEEVLVAEGQTIDRNAVVGRVGATGRATGPHLHYEIRVDGEPVDPLRFLRAGLHVASASGH